MTVITSGDRGGNGYDSEDKNGRRGKGIGEVNGIACSGKEASTIGSCEVLAERHAADHQCFRGKKRGQLVIWSGE